ncbi:MAG: hypothetical protein SFV32_06305 [Opitutaceae bacterium]|nr:hypothetical protein [Opitutaceae bacterium]
MRTRGDRGVRRKEVGKTYLARDVWRQIDIGDKQREYPVTVEGHGVMLYRLTPR